MNKYYVVSLKYSAKHHNFFTLWNPNNAGYCYAVETAGLYGEDELLDEYHFNSENATIVEKEKIKPFFEKYLVDDYICHVIPITEETLSALGISTKDLLGRGSIPFARKFDNIKDFTL